MPIPLAARSESYFLIAVIVGLNPAYDIDVCVHPSVLLCAGSTL